MIYLKPEGYDCKLSRILKHHMELGGKEKSIEKAILGWFKIQLSFKEEYVW